ncbi:MAG: strawberry notch family protein [Saprospiraceae bacterium]|nr:strawberry notch family protein [Saprospiraceae bacterium]
MQEKVYGLLEAVNMDRKDQYELQPIQPITIGNRTFYLLEAKNKAGDSVFNVVDEKGNIPKDFEANWRNFSNAMDGLNSLKSESSPLPNLNAIKNKLDNEILRQVTIKKSIKSVQKTLKKLNENLANAAIEDKNTIQNQINTLAKRLDEYSKFNEDLNESILSLRRELDRAVNLVNNSKPDSYNVGDVVTIKTRNGDYAQAEIIPHDHLDVAVVEQNGMFYTVEISTLSLLGEPGLTKQEALSNIAPTVYTRGAAILDKIVTERMSILAKPFLNHSPKIEKAIQEETNKYDNLPFLYSEAQRNKLRELVPMAKAANYLDYLNEIIDTKDRSLLPGVSPGTAKNFQDLKTEERFNFTYNNTRENIIARNKRNSSNEYMDKQIPLPLELRGEPVTNTLRDFVNTSFNSDRDLDLKQKAPELYAKVERLYELYKSIRNEYGYLPLEFEDISNSLYALSHAVFQKAPENREIAENKINTAYDKYFPGEIDINENAPQTEQEIKDELKDLITQMRNVKGVDALKELNRKINEANTKLKDIKGARENKPPTQPDIPAGPPVNKDVDKIAKDRKAAIKQDIEADGKRLMELMAKRKDIRNRGMGIIPTDEEESEVNFELMQIGYKMVANYIKLGIVEFSDMVREAANTFGELTQDFLDTFKQIYVSQKIMRKELTTTFDQVENFKLSDIPANEEQSYADFINELFDENRDNPDNLFKSVISAYISQEVYSFRTIFDALYSIRKNDMIDMFNDFVYVYNMIKLENEDVGPLMDDVNLEEYEHLFEKKENPKQKFIDTIYERLGQSEPNLNIIKIRDIANSVNLPYQFDTELQEYVEVAIIRHAKEISDHPGYTQAEKFDLILDLYKKQPTITQRTSTRITEQQYSTPIPMGFLAGEFVNVIAPRAVLEPSAGNGMMVINVPSSKITVNERDPVRLSNLVDMGFKKVTGYDAELPFDGKYEAVVMNPPFNNAPAKKYGEYTIDRLDHQMVINALDSMSNNGRAAIIIGGNTQYKESGILSNKDYAFLSYLYENYNVSDVINMDGSLYYKQGTSYETRMILIDGRRTDKTEKKYAPVQKNAKAEVIKDYKTLLERVNSVKDEILSDQTGTNINNGGGSNGLSGSGSGQGSNGGQGQGSNSGGAGKSGGSRGGRNGANQPGLSSGEQDGGLNGDNGIGPDAGASNGDGGQGDANGNGNEGDGIVDGNDNLQLPDRTDLKGVVDEKVNYKPRSRANPMLTKIPVNMVGAIEEQLDQFDDIDAFVQQKLQYPTKADLFKALDAEQIDAVALAIVQIERGSSFINGDMTGLGKGRTAAAIIRYAILQGKKPIFLTESDNLLSDIYRDMKAIGNGKNKPFIINSAAKASMTEEDDDGNIVVVHRALDTEEKEQYYIKGTLPPGTDYIAGTYSQFAGKETPIYNKNGLQTNKGSMRRKPWLRDMARNNIFIFDESHNMGGSGTGNKTSNINQFFMEIIPETQGGMFLSATFSKRPNTMPIYAIKTDMSMAMMSQQDLINAIITGGTPLQEVMSRQLVESGQMIRRDRDFDDVEIEWKDMVSTKDQDEKTYDQIIELFNDIIKFQREFIRPIIDGMNEEGAGQQGEVSLGGRSDLGVSNTPFASRAFNSTRQLLMAIKAKEIANEAIKEIQAGRKPVIAVSNTMESFLKDMGYVKGETIENTDFSMVLMRGLRSVMRYNILRGGVAVDYEDISYDDLTPEGKRMYDQIVNAINTTSSGISASPLDIVLQTIRDAGYKIDELTGRDTTIIFDKKGNPTIDTGRDKNKKRMVSQFNSGELDALIINQSGATGLSLHSSRDFKDQKQRVMLFLQMQLDINKEVQIRGRIDRFGQILRGAFRYFVSMIPAEKRLVMMFKSKLKSLDANTKASQKDKANEIELVDFLNKHGDEIATDWLKDNFDDFNEKMLDPLGMGELTVEQRATFSPPENAASKLTSKVSLLSVAEQNRFYDEVTERYVAHIQYLNDNNSNDLEMKILPFNAETLSRTVIVAGTDPTNPFAGDSVLEEIEVDVLKKQMSLKEIDEYIAKQIKPLEERIDAVDDADIAKDEEVAVVETNKKIEYVLNKFRSKLTGFDLTSDGYLSSRERASFDKELDKLKDKAFTNGTYKLVNLNGEEIQSELIDPRERFREANYFEADGNTILNRTEYYDDIIYFTSKTGEKVRLGKPNWRGVTSVDFTKRPEYQEEDGVTSDRSLRAYNNVVIDDLQKYHNNHIMKEAAKAAENTRKRLPIFMDRLMNSLNTRGITDSGIIGEAMRKAQEDFKNENDLKWESFKERNLAINQNTAGYLSMFKLKKVYMVPTTANISAETSTTEALFIGFRYNKDNMTPSGIKAVFATRDSRRRIEIPLSKRAFINASLTGSNRMFKVDPANWDSKTSNVIRKKAYVITGNLLQAFSVNRNGMLASFTTKDGQIRQGIVMPDNYDVKSQKTRVRISTMIDKLRAEGSLQDSTGDILIKREAVGWSIEVPKSQVKGAKYFNHPELRALTNGNNFRTLGKVMMATVPESRIQDLLNKLSELYNTSVSVDPEKEERGGNQRFSRKGENEPTITQEGDKFDFEFEGATATVFYNGGSYTEGQRKKEAYIEIINRPNTSQKGTGKKLLDFIKDHFKEEGAEILTLRVDNGLGFDDSGANPLFEYYANQGFKQSFPNDPDMSQALEYNLERHADLEQFRIDAPVQSDYEVIDGFYSPIEKRLAETRITRQTPAKWLSLIGSGDEAVWTGLKAWLEEKGPQEQVSKAEIYRFFKNNRVKIEVIEKSDNEVNDALEEAKAIVAISKERLMAIAREYDQTKTNPYLYLDALNNEYEWRYNNNGEIPFMKVPDEIRDEVIDLVDEIGNNETFIESVLTGDLDDYRTNQTKYGTYTLPGEKEQYKETLVTLPPEKTTKPYEQWLTENFYGEDRPEARKLYEIQVNPKTVLFQSNHWKESNIILHTRHDIRKDIDGNKVLMVEEFQSDWAKSGRSEGFLNTEKEAGQAWIDADNKYAQFIDRMSSKYGVDWESELTKEEVDEEGKLIAKREDTKGGTISKGPFVTKTSSWVKLGWKMMIREAVAQGATKIAWTTGEQQADRFDLSSRIDYISIVITPMGKFIDISLSIGMITIKVDENGIVDYQAGSTNYDDFMGKPLSDIIGSELAVKVINSPDGTRLEGIDLKVGGEGMKAFYGDPVTGNIGFVGEVAKALFKQEPKIVEIDLATERTRGADSFAGIKDQTRLSTQYSIDITPELIRMVDGGISLFSKMSDDRESITSIPIPAGFTIIPQEEDWVSIADQNGNEGYMMSKDEALKQIKDKFPVGTPEMSDPTVTDLFRFFYDLSLKQIGTILQWNDPNGEYADWINSETYDVQRNNLTNDYAQAREILRSRINDWFNEGADVELTGLYVPADGNGDSTNLFDVNEDQYDRVIQELIDSGEIETIDPETKEPCNSYSYQ